ncbi:hypothetical protein DFP72DRAFT_1058286 [Ephemerocybe angulata]|uniref:Uncharacterized protein n=1 Tax=Ephemerocybe angulata TaxID=980116 RepID=A0A8H6IHQ0_9AGAR|nr:hypothetical protein DFP72DRAFT_1075843 [Tulosesus angulatus]KAF6765731.1 hypothetical protein DFP72DRAFT_1058286 [Tulosesus angulatus]
MSLFRHLRQGHFSAQISNPEWTIFLRDASHCVIFLDSPLAPGFTILAGKQAVNVPQVAPGPYQLVQHLFLKLVGDSGNFSNDFLIIA